MAAVERNKADITMVLSVFVESDAVGYDPVSATFLLCDVRQMNSLSFSGP